MKVELNNLPKSKIGILFEISWQEFAPYLDRARTELSQDLKIKGFRPGKIPEEIIRKEIGEEKILAQASKHVIKKKYADYVFEKNLEVISPPKVEILKLAAKNPFSFKVEVEVLPEVELPNYKEIASRVKKREVSVEEKEIEETLNFLAKSKTEFKTQERKAENEDFLEIEYKSPQIENNKVFEDRFYLGKGQFVPGFEKNIIGMKKNEEREFTVTFPEEYELKKDLAGKQVTFKVKLKKVQEAKLPELNDEFAKKLGNFKNLEELKKSIKEGIKKEKETIEKLRLREEILEEIASQTKIELPETLGALEKKHMLDDLKENVKNNLKIPFEQYLGEIKKSENDLKESFTDKAKKRVKGFLILREIGKREEIEVKEEEVTSLINELLKNLPNIENPEKLDHQRLKEYYKGVIYNEKVMQLLTKASPKGEA